MQLILEVWLCVNFKHNFGIDVFSIQINITMEWVPEDIVDGNFNIGSGNGLVPSGNKLFPEPMLTQMYSTILRH